MAMRYLVTGATGFLGSHLVRVLLARGAEIVALCRHEEPELCDLGVTVARGDVLDGASVRAAAESADGLFHCAGRVSRKPGDAEELYRLHVEGTKTTLDAAKTAGVGRAVIASSSGTVAVSEDPDHIATEDDEAPIGLVQRWPYYRAKLFAEQAALARNAPGFAVISVNPTLLLGPGDERGSSTEDVRLFLERRVPAIPPGGLSYVDVRDAAEALVLAMERGAPGRRYLVGACNVTLREFFARLARISGVRAPVLPMPRAPLVQSWAARYLEKAAGALGVPMPVDATSLDMACYYWYLDASRAEEELGWRPRDPITTLADTVKDLRARGVVWPQQIVARGSFSQPPP
jgi:dihydroflavonol-4-reductase